MILLSDTAASASATSGSSDAAGTWEARRLASTRSEEIEAMAAVRSAAARSRRSRAPVTEGKCVIGVLRLQANLGAEWDVPGATGLALDARLICATATIAAKFR